MAKEILEELRNHLRSPENYLKASVFPNPHSLEILEYMRIGGATEDFVVELQVYGLLEDSTELDITVYHVFASLYPEYKVLKYFHEVKRNKRRNRSKLIVTLECQFMSEREREENQVNGLAGELGVLGARTLEDKKELILATKMLFGFYLSP